MDVKRTTFTLGKHSVKAGKPEFSGQLTLKMSRKKALDLIQRVCRELESDDGKNIELVLFGEIQDCD